MGGIKLRAKWVVETYDQDVYDLIDEIRNQKMECILIDYMSFQNEKYDLFSDDDCVIFYGSLALAKQIERKRAWIPGPYCTSKNFECITYYSHWGKYLLNQDYIMLPIMEICRRKDEIYENFGDKEIFLRPNSGLKTFNGGLYSYDNFEFDMDSIRSYGGLKFNEILAVVSTPKSIKKEWRIVIADKKPIAASQYINEGVFECEEGCENGVWELARKIGEDSWQPDRVYMLDICRTMENEYKLLEANSFSCSGLYDCDCRVIVEVASKLAFEEWKEYRDI